MCRANSERAYCSAQACSTSALRVMNSATSASGSGFVTLGHESTDNTLTINATWSGLSGVTTVAHIHCCTAVAGVGTIGVAVTPTTLPGFPAGVTDGSYSRVIDLDLSESFTGGFVTNFAGGDLANADDVLLAAFNAGTAYFNIHSALFGGGEIRGFVAPVPVPEPSTIALIGVALAGLLSIPRRRRA